MARRVSLLFLLAAALLAGAQNARAASAPPGMFNLGDWSWPTTSTLDRQSARGLRSWRVVLDFSLVGRTAGTYDWGGTDGLVRDTTARNVTPLFVLEGCPARLCAGGHLPTSGAALTEWKAFVAAAAKRYGTSGAYWAANPGYVKRPVVNWQVMNEVNGAEEWPSPNAAAYSAFLISTSQSLKSADPAARVVLAGLPEVMTIWMKDYLPALYAQPGFKAAVDVIAIHGYAADPSATAKVLDTARAVMVRSGDGAKPIWMTEFGWSTSGLAGDPFVVSESTQAAYLRGAGDLLVACAARWNLQRAYWFGWRDATPVGSGYWGYHVGLNRNDGTAKLALAAFDEFSSGATLPNGRGASCPLPGGASLDLTVPDTSIAAGPGVRTADPRPAYRFAATESPVVYQCSMDGGSWSTCTPDASGLWRPSTALVDGSHTLRVRAVDPTGNTDATPAQSTTIYDRYPPDTYVAGSWGNVVTHVMSLTLSANEPVARYECRIDSGAWSTCTSPFSASLPNGSHTISVRAVDLAGWVDPDPAVPWYQVNAN